MPQGRRADSAYDKFVNDESDFVGMVAFCLFTKEEKQYRKVNSKSPTMEQDLKAVTANWTNADSIRIRREQAVRITSDFVNNIVDTKRDDLLNSIVLKDLSRIEKKVSFWQSVASNVVAGLFTTVIFALIALVLWSLKEGNEIKDLFINLLSEKRS
jgi:hypothetical protein